VIDDPDDLLGKQPRIDGVIDRADAEDAVPAFQMPPAVPGERRDAVAELDAVAFEPLRHAQGAGADLRIIGAMNRSFDRACDHRPLRMVERGVIDDAMAQERPILHKPEHDVSSHEAVCCCCVASQPEAATPFL